MTGASGPARPAPGSHERGDPTGALEVSAAGLFEAMLAARDAPPGDPARLHDFYRALAGATLLLPLPPGSGEEARRSLEAALGEEDEVEIPVMLARGGDGEPLNVLFASGAALGAWSPAGTGQLPLPARIVFTNLAASGLPAILDPAGPIPYRFEPEELAALADGRIPGTDAPIAATGAVRSLRLRLPGPEALDLERTLRPALADSGVREAYLVESVDADGPRLLLGLVGAGAGGRLPELPHRVDVVRLEEPLLGEVRALTGPFHRAGRRR